LRSEFLTALLQASRDGLVVTDLDGTIVEASDSFCSLLSRSRPEVIGICLPSWLAESGADANQSWLELEQGVFDGSGRGECELEVVTPRGVRRLSVTAMAVDQKNGGKEARLVSVWRDVTKRKLEKRALRLTQFAVDRATECILRMRSDGRLLYVNEATCRTLGYSADELLSLKISDIDMGFSVKQWSKQWDDIRSRRSYTVESLFRKRDGAVFPVDVSISYRKFGSDAFAYAVARDISKRRQAEEALRLIQDRYAMATRAARTGVWDWNVRTGGFFVDPIIMRILGYEDEDAPDNKPDWDKLIHPDDLDAAVDAARDCLDGKTTVYSLEHRMLHKDGSFGWILARGQVVRNAAGNPIRVVGTNTDITERRQAEEELREFQVIADNANYGMAVGDVAGHLLYLNNNFASVHGYTVDELLGENLALFHSDDQLAAVREVNATLLREGKYGPTEVWHTHRDGTAFPMLMNGIIIPDDRGAPLFLATTAVDISPRVRAERALEAKEHQQGMIASLGRQALASGDLDELLGETVRSVTATLGISLCGIIEAGADGSEFLLREGVGWNCVGVELDVGPEWQGGRAIHQAKTIVVEDTTEDSRFDQPSLFRDHGVISSATVPIRGWGRPFGVLAACADRRRAFDGDDVNFLEGVANILAHALERTQAEEALAMSQERLRNLAARLHAVREEERTVIARDIHDQLGQSLTGLKMDLSWLMRRLPDDPAIRDRAESMEVLLDSTVESVRSISTQLRPPILDDLGLEAAVEWQVHEFARQSGINCQLDLRVGDTFVREEHATAAFRILQESLVNVARHAQADNVTVEVRLVGKTLFLVVSDDGCGIGDVTLSSTRSIGLIGMRERAGALGGEVDICRMGTGGTRVKLELPLERNIVGEAL
jgi:PAS domain S-box-containing protein